MRFPPFVLFSLLCCSLGLWFVLQSDGSHSFEEFVPDDVLALVVVRDPSEDVELLTLGVWSEFFDESLQSVIDRTSGEWAGHLKVLKSAARRMAVVVHGFEPRGEQSYKVHLTVLIQPRPGGAELVNSALLELAEKLLGTFSSERTAREESLLRGEKPEEVLYRFRIDGLFALSNSEPGRAALKRISTGVSSPLSKHPSFREIRARLDHPDGVFVYCNPRPLLPMLLPFGWRIWNEKGTVRDEFYVLGGEPGIS